MSGRARAVAGAAALVAAAIAAGIASVEFAVRLTGRPVWLLPGDPDKDGLFVPDPLRGYALAPDADRIWARADWSNRVRTNAHGLRAEPLERLRDAELRVLAVGDSFTMGIGVEAHETWPEQLADALAARTAMTVSVANAGVPGYSTTQIRQTVEHWLPLLEPQGVVLAFYTASFWRNDDPYTLLGPHQVTTRDLPHLDLGDDGSLVRTRFTSGRARDLEAWCARRFHLCVRALSLWSPDEESLGPPRLDAADADAVALALRPALREVARARDLAAAAGAWFVLLVVSDEQPGGGFDAVEHTCSRVIAAFCEREAMICVDPLARFEAVRAAEPDPALHFRYPTDQHWTARAHAIAADALGERIDREFDPGFGVDDH